MYWECPDNANIDEDAVRKTDSMRYMAKEEGTTTPAPRTPRKHDPHGRARERGSVIQQPDERAQGEEDGGTHRSSFGAGLLQQPSWPAGASALTAPRWR